MNVILFPAQSRRLWHQEQLDPSLRVLLQPDCLIRGPLSAEQIVTALQRIVARHGALRTGVVEREGEPCQMVWPHPMEIPIVNCSGSRDEAWRQAIAVAGETQVASMAAAPPGTPLNRMSVLHRSTDEHALVFTAHHMILDGWSLGLLARELLMSLEGLVLANEAPQFADFLAQEQALLAEPAEMQRLAGRALAAATPEEGWERILRRRSGASSTPNMVFLPAETAEAVSIIAQHARVTAFTVLLTCFAIALATVLGTSMVRIGVPTANRNGRGMRRVLGLLATTLVVDLPVKPTDTPVEAVERTYRTLADADPTGRPLPIASIIERLGKQVYLSRGELAHVQFNLLPLREKHLATDKFRIVPALVRPVSPVMQQELAVMIAHTAVGTLVATSHRPELDQTFAAQVLEMFVTLPRRLVTSLTEPIRL